jgi:isocitrate/isopropylmalate dehydrogenase
MLDWHGEREAKASLMEAVENVCRAGILTRDLGGTASTKDVTKAVCDEIERLGKWRRVGAGDVTQARQCSAWM